jgi:ACT domain-containing protein
MSETSKRVIVTVIGEDRIGIIAAVARILADADVNIVDISQTVMQEFFVMIMMADMKRASLPFEELKRHLNAKGAELGLRIDAQHEDVFRFMHRI